MLNPMTKSLLKFQKHFEYSIWLLIVYQLFVIDLCCSDTILCTKMHTVLKFLMAVANISMTL